MDNTSPYLDTLALLSTATEPVLPLREKGELLAEVPAGAGTTKASAACMIADGASMKSNDVPAAAASAAARRILQFP